MKYLIIFILTFSPFIRLFSQETGDFSIELNVNGNGHNMSSAYQYINESNTYAWTSINTKKSGLNTLNTGLDYNLVISYQPISFIDFGIYANYQMATLKRTFSFEYHPDPFLYPDSSYIRNGKVQNQVSAFCLGLSTNLYLNKLLHFERSKAVFVRNLSLSIGLKGGVGLSSFIEKSEINGDASDYKFFNYNVSSFIGRTEIGIAYPLINNIFFSSIGLKAGYQFFKTSPVKNYADIYLHTEHSAQKVYLDFSGIYYGIYLKIGKH